MASKSSTDTRIEAAGGVVHRRHKGVVEVLVVHRPKYDDWSLPKGKYEAGETGQQCALREVEEETGLRCALGEELVGTSYVDRHGRPKTVRYWVMQAVSGDFTPNHEVDEVCWLTPNHAAQRLTYPRDAEVLASFSATRRAIS